jgi:hypothetical protein
MAEPRQGARKDEKAHDHGSRSEGKHQPSVLETSWPPSAGAKDAVALVASPQLPALWTTSTERSA